jgi:hypothetical protein
LTVRKAVLLLPALLMAAAGAAAQSLESLAMPGKVIEGHAKYEGECRNCHVRFEKGAQAKLCLDCHKEIAVDVRDRTGYHGRAQEAYGKDCRTCHTEHKGRDARIAAFDTARFNHGETDLPLRGAHAGAQVECKSCHAAGKKYRGAPTLCNDCHRKDDKHKGALGPKCETCHTEKNWKEAAFDHSKTRFPLEGRHGPLEAKRGPVACKDCHAESRFKDAPRECVACHRKDDEHKGRYGAKCETCHNASAWTHTFRHDTQTKFALHGKHAQVKCDGCHKGVLYREKVGTNCIACHRADDAHKGSLGDKCERCHGERSWKTSSFDHDKDTHFALLGRHRNAKCESCHKPGEDRKTPKACIACHRKDDTSHKGRYGDKCEYCHAEKSWKEWKFDHDRETKYRLLGKHKQARCDSCHTGELYTQRLAADCISCHRKDDKHRNQLGQACERCHSEDSWNKVASFDHNRTRFPLLGRHGAVKCASCHATPAYRDAKSDCHSCHQKDDTHKGTLGRKCETCHNARDWKSWDFNHDRRTKFALDGGHAKLRCDSCHRAAAEDARLPKGCFACHEKDDVHEGRFGRVCERCHFTSKFGRIKPGMSRGVTQ